MKVKELIDFLNTVEDKEVDVCIQVERSEIDDKKLYAEFDVNKAEFYYGTVWLNSYVD